MDRSAIALEAETYWHSHHPPGRLEHLESRSWLHGDGLLPIQ